MEIAVTLLVLGAIVGGVAFIWHYSDRQVMKRALRTAPQVPMRAFPDGGCAKVVGAVVLQGEPLRAPLTGRPCAFWEVRVEEGAQGRHNWSVVIDDRRGTDFLVRDETGEALIEVSNARVVIVHDVQARSGAMDSPSPEQKRLLSLYGHPGRGLFLNRSFRYREGVLAPGESVVVCGYGLREPDVGLTSKTPGYRDQPPMRLCIRGSRKIPVLISDDPGIW